MQSVLNWRRQPAEGRAGSLVGLVELLVVTAALVVLLRDLRHLCDDPGFGWHLKTGEWIVEKGQVPMLDPFLSWPSPRHWVADQWLGDLLLYSVWHETGWVGFYIFAAVWFLLTYFLVVYPLLCRITGSRLASAVAASIALKIGTLHFLLRPTALSFVFFGAAALALVLQLRRGAGRSFGRCWFFLPLLFVIWANIHPSFMLGLAAVALVPLAVVVDGLIRPPVSPRDAARGLLLFGLCAAVTLFNPNTIHLHESVLQLHPGGFFAHLYGEWQPPDFRETAARLLEAMLLLIAVGVFLRADVARRWSTFEIVLALAFFHLALQAVRILPFAAIACSPLFAESLAGVGQGVAQRFSQAFRLAARVFGRIEAREQRAIPGVAAAVAAAALIVYACISGTVPGYHRAFGPSRKTYPYAALDALHEEAGHRGVAVLASPDYGGFITWYAWPTVRAVIDDRSSLLGEPIYRDFMEALKPGGDWRSFVREVGANYLLLQHDSAFAWYLRAAGGPRIVHEDERFVLFAVGA